MTRFLRWIPVAILGTAIFLISVSELWLGDSIGYSFLVSEDPDFVSNTPLNNLADLLTSQMNHYLAVNGRFVVHVVVQLFCAFLPQWVFALCNAAVWVLLLQQCARLAGLRLRELEAGTMTLAVSAMVIIMRFGNFQPPVQINYIWTALLTVVTLRLFFHSRKTGAIRLAAIAIVALVCGQANEAFSMPVALLMLGYAIHKRFRLTLTQWIMGPAYAAGTIILCIAPGNFIRLDDISANANPPAQQFEVFVSTLIPMGTALILWIFRDRTERAKECVRPMGVLIVLSFAMALALRFSSGQRMVAAAYVAAFVILLSVADSIRHRRLLTMLIAAGAVWTWSHEWSEMASMRRKYEVAIYHDYPSSPDGRVYIADKDFALQFRDLAYHSLYFTRSRQAADPDAPPLTLLPESLRRLHLAADTNASIRLDENSWLIIRSETHPARFILSKRVDIPGFSFSLQDRELDLGDSGDILIDTTSMSRIGFYVNDRPYITPRITVINQK